MEKEPIEIGLNCLKIIGALAIGYLGLILGAELGLLARYGIRGGGLYLHNEIMNKAQEMWKKFFYPSNEK